jgi:hypothetical protein
MPRHEPATAMTDSTEQARADAAAIPGAGRLRSARITAMLRPVPCYTRGMPAGACPACWLAGCVRGGYCGIVHVFNGWLAMCACCQQVIR